MSIEVNYSDGKEIVSLNNDLCNGISIRDFCKYFFDSKHPNMYCLYINMFPAIKIKV